MDMEGMPAVVLTVTVAMIMLGVGVFAFYITYSEIGYTTDHEQTFNVTNPSVTNTEQLRYHPTSISAVYQYNGIEWLPVDPSFYSFDGKWFSIQPGGMQG